MPAPVPNSSGNQLCVISTEHTLATTTTPGYYEVHLVTQPMQASDTLLLRIKTFVADGGTTRDIHRTTYNNAQAEPYIKVHGPIALPRGCTVTLTQSAGTGRTIPWSLVRVG